MKNTKKNKLGEDRQKGENAMLMLGYKKVRRYSLNSTMKGDIILELVDKKVSKPICHGCLPSICI